MGFVFYDTETTGLKKGFDQIVQFAAIHTDADLTELDRFEVRCRLQPHVVPHPKAMLANGLPIERLTDAALPSHYDMVREVRWRLAQWGKAIFIGYNSIRFDEEMLRHAFFQSLFPAYLTSAPGCGRADAMHVVLAACAERNPCLTLPTDENGRTTFRLEAVALANGLGLGGAHDAVVDADMTLALCRRVAGEAPDVWSRLVRTANKAAVSDMVEAEPVCVFTEFFGFEATHRFVSYISREVDNPNGRLCWDLATDPSESAMLKDEDLATLIAERNGPLRRLRVNAAPALAMSWDTPADWVRGDIVDAERRAEWLQENPAFGARVGRVHAARWAAREPSQHPELQLYDGFPNDGDQALMAEFHDSGKDRRREIVDLFDDKRLRIFGRRLLHMEHRSAFTDHERQAADLDLAERLLLERDGPLTLSGARAVIREMGGTGLDNSDDVLKGYALWLDARIAKVSAFIDKS